MKPKFKIKHKELKEYLETLTEKDFQGNHNQNPDCKIKEGHSIYEIEVCEIDKSEITLDTVIFYGTPFLVDAIGNDLSVVMLTKRKYKLPTGRSIHGIFDKTIIDDCRKLYGTPMNSYFIIPDRFLEKI